MVPSVCAVSVGSPTISKPITPDGQLSVPRLDCVGRRWLTRFTVLKRLFVPFVYKSCTCNEWVAIKGRVLGVVPRLTDLGYARLRRELAAVAQKFPKTQEMDRSKFIEHFKGSKRTLYNNALKSLDRIPVRRSDGYVTAFIKAEKTDPSAKKHPDPRVIQARSPRYNICLGAYLRPIEHHVYRLKHNGLPVMGKGLSPPRRAELLVEKWNRFSTPVCFAIDASRFDQHVDVRALRLEHKFYLKSNRSAEFAELLSWQLKNIGFTRNDVKYSCVGRRMSGDMNTAVGNCLLMFAMCCSAMETSGITKYELLVDGDDTLCIVEQKDEHRFAQFLEDFKEFGHEIKMEGRSTTLEGLKWCQSRFMYINGVPNFVRPWDKVISTLTCGVRHWADPSIQKNIMFTVGQALMIDNVGVPILGKFGKCLCRYSNQRIADWTTLDEGFLYDVKQRHGLNFVAEYQEPTTESRLSFERAYGLSIDEQLDIENEIEQWEPEFGNPQLVDDEIVSGWLTNYRPDLEPIP